MDLVEQVHDDVDAVVIDAHAVGQVADQFAAGEVDLAEPASALLCRRDHPALLDPEFEHGDFDVQPVAEFEFVEQDVPQVRDVAGVVGLLGFVDQRSG